MTFTMMLMESCQPQYSKVVFSFFSAYASTEESRTVWKLDRTLQLQICKTMALNFQTTKQTGEVTAVNNNTCNLPFVMNFSIVYSTMHLFLKLVCFFYISSQCLLWM